MPQIPSRCRIVEYKLTAKEAEIANERVRGGDARGVMRGGYERAGAVLPMVITRVWPDEFGPGTYGVNGQVLLDGDGSIWVTSAKEGTGEGEWSWPVIVKVEPARPVADPHDGYVVEGVELPVGLRRHYIQMPVKPVPPDSDETA